MYKKTLEKILKIRKKKSRHNYCSKFLKTLKIRKMARKFEKIIKNYENYRKITRNLGKISRKLGKKIRKN